MCVCGESRAAFVEIRSSGGAHVRRQGAKGGQEKAEKRKGPQDRSSAGFRKSFSAKARPQDRKTARTKTCGTAKSERMQANACKRAHASERLANANREESGFRKPHDQPNSGRKRGGERSSLGAERSTKSSPQAASARRRRRGAKERSTAARTERSRFSRSGKSEGFSTSQVLRGAFFFESYVPKMFRMGFRIPQLRQVLDWLLQGTFKYEHVGTLRVFGIVNPRSHSHKNSNNSKNGDRKIVKL